MPDLKNAELAALALTELQRQGVAEFIVCAGARNAPLLQGLGQLGIHSIQHFEERSAAFFALGRARRSGRPVAVMTTSGTAAAELLPAMIEGYYSGVQLVAVTADRPKRFRGSGAPQAIEQFNLFGVYPGGCIEWDKLEQPAFSINSIKPTHLNICFEEPGSEHLIPTVSEQSAMPFEQVRRPLVIVSGLLTNEQELVLAALLKWQAPVYLEASSGLRARRELEGLRLSTPCFTASSFSENFDGIIRIGGIPTLRLWRDLDLGLAGVSVLQFSRLPFAGLAREQAAPRPLAALREHSGSFAANPTIFERDGKLLEQLNAAMKEFPNSEVALVQRLAQSIPAGSSVFLGNSLPIREWDLVGWDKEFLISANRGANGIDGLVSTFLGEVQADTAREHWLILGDLSALYDLAGLWSLQELPKCKIRIVVLNNGGGQIFSRLFKSREFLNEHELRFKGWAEIFGVSYYQELRDSYDDVALIELQPDNQESEQFWSAFQKGLQ